MDQIVVVVDRSGSMAAIKEDAEGGLNEFLKAQKDVGEARLTLAQFDNEYEVVYDDKDLKLFENYSLQPRGMTALFDAIGRTAANTKDVEVSGKRIFVIVTDGAENASREWNRDKVLESVNEMKEAGWEFVFLAADEHTLKNAASFGMDRDTSFMFDGTKQGIRASYTAMTNYASSIRGGTSKAQAVKDLDDAIASNENMSKGN